MKSNKVMKLQNILVHKLSNKIVNVIEQYGMNISFFVLFSDRKYFCISYPIKIRPMLSYYHIIVKLIYYENHV